MVETKVKHPSFEERVAEDEAQMRTLEARNGETGRLRFGPVVRLGRP